MEEPRRPVPPLPTNYQVGELPMHPHKDWDLDDLDIDVDALINQRRVTSSSRRKRHFYEGEHIYYIRIL